MTDPLASYQGFDFRRMWQGREKTIRLEIAIGKDAFQGEARKRLLDAGAGFGRLLLPLSGLFAEVAGVDLNPEGLDIIDKAGSNLDPLLLATGNVYHLPFADGSFDAVVCSRVLHHLSDPARAIAELLRVTAPGGALLLSYNPRPSLGTLLSDLNPDRGHRQALDVWPLTRTSPDFLQVARQPFPVYSSTPAHFEGLLSEQGAQVEQEYASGLEDLFPFRLVPYRFWETMALDFEPFPGFPSVFVKLRKGGQLSSLPPYDSILRCPLCRLPLELGLHPAPSVVSVTCPHCGNVGEHQGRVYRLRISK